MKLFAAVLLVSSISGHSHLRAGYHLRHAPAERFVQASVHEPNYETQLIGDAEVAAPVAVPALSGPVTPSGPMSLSGPVGTTGGNLPPLKLDNSVISPKSP